MAVVQLSYRNILLIYLLKKRISSPYVIVIPSWCDFINEWKIFNNYWWVSYCSNNFLSI